MKRLAAPLLVLVLAGCGADNAPESGETRVPKTVSQRWDALTEAQQQAVCTEMDTPAQTADPGSGQIPQDRPDYRGMLKALMDAGYDQPEASAMLPYAANVCT